jgi:endonuclease/exonuclease/phosphatase family metal-dependent hydrolase
VSLDAGGDVFVPTDAGPAQCGNKKVRIVAGNLSSGTGQTYDAGHGIRIWKALSPDVALIQEFKYGDNGVAAQRAFVDAAFGAEFAFVRGASANGSDIPNGIASRYPIVDSGDWVDPQVSNRAFTWARIDVPGPTDLYAVSVHLLTTSASDRNAEASALLGRLQSLPSNAFVVVGGDLNTNVRDEAALGTLSPVLQTKGPYPADQAGNANTSAPRSKPYDWVIGNGALHGCARPTEIGGATFAAGLVFDTRVFSPLDAVPPATVGDSDAPSMQHMAVVREFGIAD